MDGRLGPLLGQRIEAFSDPARQDHHETLVEHGASFRFRSARRDAPSQPANRSGRQNRPGCPGRATEKRGWWVGPPAAPPGWAEAEAPGLVRAAAGRGTLT